MLPRFSRPRRSAAGHALDGASSPSSSWGTASPLPCAMRRGRVAVRQVARGARAWTALRTRSRLPAAPLGSAGSPRRRARPPCAERRCLADRAPWWRLCSSSSRVAASRQANRTPSATWWCAGGKILTNLDSFEHLKARATCEPISVTSCNVWRPTACCRPRCVCVEVCVVLRCGDVTAATPAARTGRGRARRLRHAVRRRAREPCAVAP